MQDTQSAPALRGALKWIAQNLDFFDPFCSPEPFTVARAQPACELAVSLYCCTIHQGPNFSEHAESITAFLAELRAKDEFSDRLLRSPAGFVLLVYIYAALRLRGKDDTQQREMMQRVITAGYLEQDERPPHRVMDLRLALEWADLTHRLPTWEDLGDASILAQPVRVPCIDVSAAYAFTHALFFSFGFGTRPAAPGSWFNAVALQRTLSALLISFCQVRDWDLVGELLLCWECAALPNTLIYDRAWELFLEQQEPNGAFPGPERRRRGSGDTKKDEDPDRRYFARHYHTTLVAVMALSCRSAKLRRSPVARTAAAENGDLPPGPLPSVTDLTLAVTRTSDWVLALLDELERNSSSRLDALCRALVVLWMCEELVGRDDRRNQVKRIASLLAAHHPLEGAWDSIPAGLKLLSASLLAAEGHSVTALDSFFQTALAALDSAPPVNAESDLPLCEKRIFFFATGLLPKPPLLGLRDVLVTARTLKLHDHVAFDDLVSRVSSCTGYGIHSVELPHEAEWLAELLNGAAMHFLRAYDLSRASRLIRTLASLGSGGSQSAKDCCSYLLAQQRPSGRFGFLGPEIADLAQSTPQFSAATDLHLPLILDCTWTLGECIAHPWRFYSALPTSREHTGGDGVSFAPHAQR